MPYRDAEVKALKTIPNKYLLTVLVCKRAKQLLRGAKPLIDEDGENIFDTALKEIATGKIILKEVEVQPEPAEQNDIPAVEPNDPPPAQ